MPKIDGGKIGNFERSKEHRFPLLEPQREKESLYESI